jgi:hypothetical protein
MPDLDPESDGELNDNLWFSIQADFNTDDAQINGLCDDIDASIEQFVKPEISEPRKPFRKYPSLARSRSLATNWRLSSSLLQRHLLGNLEYSLLIFGQHSCILRMTI